ncbi:hypothetical protein BaRGS_00012222, partial [Batillaria attramentaria]
FPAVSVKDYVKTDRCLAQHPTQGRLLHCVGKWNSQTVGAATKAIHISHVTIYQEMSQDSAGTPHRGTEMDYTCKTLLINFPNASRTWTHGGRKGRGNRP